MRQVIEFLVRAALLVVVWWIWSWALEASLTPGMNLAILMGAVLVVFPIVWLGRRMLDQQPTPSRMPWITTFVHYALGLLFGLAIIRAIETHQDWTVWILPIPTDIGYGLVMVTSAITLLAVINLALKGLGAPFAIALSQKLAMDWMYAWTRNPMVLASLALLVSLGIWYQSVPFVLWALLCVSPALLFFVKVYEERELELRFGASYLEYKAKTPMLFPRRPRKQNLNPSRIRA